MLFLLLAACTSSDPVDTGACTDMGCQSGLFIDLELRTSASYVVTLTADGTDYACVGAVPFDGSESCEAPFSMTLSGTALPADEQYIDGFSFDGTPAAVHFAVQRGGEEVLSEDLSPTYDTLQPNGPTCGPTCEQASASYGSL